MPIYLRSGSAWKPVDDLRIRISNAWSIVKEGYIRVSGAWKQFFSSENTPSIAQQVTISQSAPDSLNGLITLTGTNYHWTNYQTLTYYFEWSTDGGSTWTIINTGSITNPSSGSSNQKFYTVTVANTSPNIDNLYRFRVFAQNITLTNSSTSNSTTISTPRNISISYYDKTYNSITVEFDTKAYAGSYQVRIGSDSYESTLGTVVGSKTRVTATGLSSNTPYTIRVKPYTGGLVFIAPEIASNKGYPGNESNSVTATTNNPPTPTKTTSPSEPTGTASPFNTLEVGVVGSYTNYNTSGPQLITTNLVKILQGTPVTDGSTTSAGTIVSSPYTVTQSDATIQKYNFYTRDSVPGLDGNTYYYYSTQVSSFIGPIIDTFNRTTINGLGTSSSGYIYNGPKYNAQTWSTNGSVAVSSASVPSGTTAASNFAFDTVEVNDPNVSLNIAAHGAVPSGSLAGYGVSVWVASENNWWSVISTYDSSAFLETRCIKYNCYNAGCCPSGLCSSCTFLHKNDCVSGAGSTQTTTSSTPNCTNFTDSCGGCTSNGQETRYGYSRRDTSATYSYSPWVSEATVTYSPWVAQSGFAYSQIVCFGGSCFCESGYFSTTCPSVPAGCDSITGCTNISTTYNNQRCSQCQPSTDYTCGSDVTIAGTTCPDYSVIGAANKRCTSSCTSGTRIVCGSATTGSSCPGYSATPSVGSRCSSADCGVSYPCNTTVSYDTVCPTEGTGSGQRCSACTDQIVYNWTFPKYLNKYEYGLNQSVSGYNYNSRLQLVSSVNGLVSYPTWNDSGNGIVKNNKVDGSLDNSNYTKISGINVSTSGENITATASTPTEVFTSLIKTTSGIIKTAPDGSVSSGIIKGYTSALSSEGRIDRLGINE